MEWSVRRVVLNLFMLVSGAAIALVLLLGMGSEDIATTICGRPANLHVAWALPMLPTGDYSDADTNVEDCGEPAPPSR